MTKFLVEYFAASGDDEWDAFNERASNGTFMTSRNFLNYHGDRFTDRSAIVRNTDGEIVATIPAAVLPADSSAIESHPGATYGGIVFDKRISGSDMVELCREVAKFYSADFSTLRMRMVPFLYRSTPVMLDDLWAMYPLGAHRYRADLSSVIDLEHPGKMRKDRSASLKKAQKSGIEINTSQLCDAPVKEFWSVVEQTLSSRHGVKPAHSLAEIEDLSQRFPMEMGLTWVELDGELIAGALTWHKPNTTTAQYIANNPKGRELAAVDLIMEHVLEQARQRGDHYFNFGPSTENEGRELNDDLYGFKTSFGAGSFVFERYELDLTSFRSAQ